MMLINIFLIQIINTFDLDTLYQIENSGDKEAFNSVSLAQVLTIPNSGAKSIIYDQTGIDGLDEEKLLEGSIERQQQRARSAVSLFIQSDKQNNMEIFGVSIDNEVLKNYIIFDVLLNNQNGEHKILKVCLSSQENQKTQYVIEFKQQCSEQIKIITNPNYNEYRFRQDLSEQNHQPSKQDLRELLVDIKMVREQVSSLNSKLLTLKNSFKEKLSELNKKPQKSDNQQKDSVSNDQIQQNKVSQAQLNPPQQALNQTSHHSKFLEDFLNKIKNQK